MTGVQTCALPIFHDSSFSSESIPTYSLTLPDEDHDVVLETVVDCAFMEPSLFLSE